MKTTNSTKYAVYVMRRGAMIAYSAEEHGTKSLAHASAQKLRCSTGEGYMEIRKIVRTETITCVDRIEQ